MAKNEIGVNITNNPDRVKQYLSSVGLPPANPWCMSFVYWCASQLENNKLLKTGSCQTQLDHAKKHNLILNQPQVGCVFICKFSGTWGNGLHTGIVTSFDADKLYTIEGNTSSSNVGDQRNSHCVAEKKRPHKIIIQNGIKVFEILGFLNVI
jgi:hypothetical protein